MGGSGGKRQRERQKASTVGGKFNSIGSAEEQRANKELVVKLMGEVGSDGERMVSSNDRLFLQDVRIKMNQMGNSAAFGWRQVEAMVRIHAEVMGKRKGQEEKANGKQHGTGSQGASAEVDRVGEAGSGEEARGIKRGNGPLDTPPAGGV